MNGGRIEQNGTPVDLYERPANVFVARFIGTPPMNLLALERGADGAVLEGTEGPVVLPAEYARGKLGIRPEHIALEFGRGVPATVQSVEYLGGDSLLGCRSADSRSRCACRAASACRPAIRRTCAGRRARSTISRRTERASTRARAATPPTLLA